MTMTPDEGFVLLLTGLPGSGKSTLARAVVDYLKEDGIPAVMLDDNECRERLFPLLGFSRKDRETNITRIASIAAIVAREGVNVVVSAISPFEKLRQKIRERFDYFIEVFCDCDLETLKQRDTRGLYALAEKGEIEMNGVNAPYDIPQNPDIHLRTDSQNEEECLFMIYQALQEGGYLHGPR